LEVAQEYVKTCDNPDLEIFVIKMYKEPRDFTQYFFGWNDSKYPKLVDTSEYAVPISEVFGAYVRQEYTYQELLADPLPKGVDRTQLENYLTDEEFKQVFKMSREEYLNIPKWKHAQLKKDVGLF